MGLVSWASKITRGWGRKSSILRDVIHGAVAFASGPALFQAVIDPRHVASVRIEVWAEPLDGCVVVPSAGIPIACYKMPVGPYPAAILRQTHGGACHALRVGNALITGDNSLPNTEVFPGIAEIIHVKKPGRGRTYRPAQRGDEFILQPRVFCLWVRLWNTPDHKLMKVRVGPPHDRLEGGVQFRQHGVVGHPYGPPHYRSGAAQHDLHLVNGMFSLVMVFWRAPLSQISADRPL